MTTLGDLQNQIMQLATIYGPDLKVIACDGNSGIDMEYGGMFVQEYTEDDSDEAGILADNLVLGEKYISLQVE